MNRKSLGALVALNAVLLLALVLVTMSPPPQPAHAQFQQNDYLMISGEVIGQRNRNAVYILETRSGRVVALMFNGGNKKLEVIDGRDLAKDLKAPVLKR